jgi:hypothetical protein
MGDNGKIMDAELAPGRDLPAEYEELTNPDQWEKFPMALKPNESWSLMQLMMGFEGAYMTQTWDTSKVVEAKMWRDAKPGRKLFFRKTLEQITEVQEEF